ncbi:MAG TPA: MarR family transcriptional regulator [Solirubrobacteraceae bacterium]|nr:MarR family transcriptional regulator [Solirubrobacteraceae bacterium]
MSNSPLRTSPPEGASETPPNALASRLGFLLKHAQLRYQSIQASALAPFDLDGRLLAVLTLVGAEGPALQARLAERLQVDRTTMVALVDRLEQAGLVERHRDPTDRRGYHVNITTTGSRALNQALDAVETVERDFLGALSMPEQQQFRALLAKVALDP